MGLYMLGYEGEIRMDDIEDAMQERLHMLEEALERAEDGEGSEADWAIIRYECGIPRKLIRSE